MKKNNAIFLLSFIMAIVFFASCGDKNPVPNPVVPPVQKDSSEIVLQGTIAASSQQTANTDVASGLVWSPTVSVGVFMSLGSVVTPGTYGLVAGSLTADQKAGNFKGTFFWTKKSTQYTFMAYYPIAGVNDPKKIPVSVSPTQTQTGTGSEQLNIGNVVVGKPVTVTSPSDLTNPLLNPTVKMDFISALSAIEFRFASYNKTGLLINKVTLTSDNGYLTVQGGNIDITQPDFATNFAQILGGQRGSSVVLTVQNPMEAPLSSSRSTIPGDDGTKPADLTKVFPVRMLVTPNVYASVIDPSKQEKWTVTLETNQGEFSQTFSARITKPGEKQVIQYVVPTTPADVGVEEDPDVAGPGEPWNGSITPPNASAVDNTNKIITIKTAGELAWLASTVNAATTKIPVTLVADTFFTGYTIKIVSNINLNGVEWTPIGVDSRGNQRFKGTLDGTYDKDPTKGYIISGLKITAPHNSATNAYAYIGLFGYAGPQMIKNVVIKDAQITIPSYSGITYTGGFVAWVPAGSPTQLVNCSFSGTISVTYAHSSPVGGLIGLMDGGSITGCSSSANITASNNLTYSATGDMGGIAGNSSVPIKACAFYGTLNGAAGGWTMGGIVGTAKSSVTACKNAGALTYSGVQTKMGGIVGSSTGNIIACYNTGVLSTAAASGDQYTKADAGMGGIAGSFGVGTAANSGSWLKGCYSTTTLQNGITQLAGSLGNIVGKFTYLTGTPVYDRVINNYYKGTVLTSDVVNGMGVGHSTRFSATQWPSPSLDGWAIGDGSGDTYWNPVFPSSFGDTYPALYWENAQ